MNLKQELQPLLKGNIIDNKKTLEKYSHDASLFEVHPQLVVFPNDIEDLKNLVTFANEHMGVTLTPRSGGTDMTGGPLGESIIVDMTVNFNNINNIGDDYVITQPGVYYRDLEKVLTKKNLLLPSYPASKEICTVGGMVANNAGGEKTLAYGKTEKYVQAMKMILADGNIYDMKPMNKTELDDVMKKKNFAANAIRKLYRLIEKNKDIIDEARPTVSKNSSGYALWNVWDGNTFDITKLFIGSQGTLGIITEIKFRLITPKKYSALLVVFLNGFKKLPIIVDAVLQEKPESFESYDDHTLRLAVRYLWTLIKLIKPKNIFSLAWQFIPELLMTIKNLRLPKLVLLGEFTGDDKIEVFKRTQRVATILRRMGVTVHVTTNKDEIRKYFVIRRESFNLLRHHLQHERTAPFIDDIIVAPKHLNIFLPKLITMLDRSGLRYTMAGHIGDGNFHIIPLMNLKDPRIKTIIPDIAKQIYGLTLEFNGSITAEHNDGIIRTPFIEQMFGKRMHQLFEEVKNIFDPKEIFNPGKKIGGTIDYAMTHLRSDKRS